MLFLGLAACSHALHVCVLGICAPVAHHRLKSLKHALFNVYLESFLGSVDTFTRSTEAQLVVSY